MARAEPPVTIGHAATIARVSGHVLLVHRIARAVMTAVANGHVSLVHRIGRAVTTGATTGATIGVVTKWVLLQMPSVQHGLSTVLARFASLSRNNRIASYGCSLMSAAAHRQPPTLS